MDHADKGHGGQFVDADILEGKIKGLYGRMGCKLFGV